MQVTFGVHFLWQADELDSLFSGTINSLSFEWCSPYKIPNYADLSNHTY